jgi:hypothetical protein
MKTKLLLAALSLASLAIANNASANAYEFKDTGSFTATGSLTAAALAVTLPCSAVMTGTTTGAAQVTGATFSGLSCFLLSAGNLPWKMHANAPHSFTLKGLEVSALILGVCGPGKVKSQLNAKGDILITSASLPGLLPCTVSANLTTEPSIIIIPKKH